MTGHYHPCVNCSNAQDAFYQDMFYCAARNRQIPIREVMTGCEYYERRLDKEMQ